MSCPDETTLSRWAAGAPTENLTSTAVRAHVENCATCAGRIEELQGTQEDPPGGPARPRPTPAELHRGASLGRYLILDVLGRGGMGEVYVADDPELGRRVAIKLLRASKDASADASVRLLREAQALARLSHPNVLPIYDVGVVDGRAFFAMEYVPGDNLRNWLAQRQRSWREVLDVFIAAGRGLSAAHAAGLIHRDFKPDNVLIGLDGRVRVMDFGLARAGEVGLRTATPSPPGTPIPLSDSDSGGGLLEAPLTATGSLMGTPAYMAPEQRVGASDSRSDQYSFCVALYEALHGVRPAAATERPGPPPPSRPRGEVPSWVDRIVARGLSQRPDTRWPSMDALLDALAKDPAVARRKWLTLGVAGALAASTVTVSIVSARRQGAVCRGGAETTGQVWNEARKGALRTAFLATGVPYAGSSWNEAQHRLDDFTLRWAEQHGEACEDTRVRGEQPEEILGLRMLCLDERLKELSALLAVWDRPDAPMVERAVLAAASLSDPRDCADIQRLSAPPRLAPDSPEAERAKAVTQRIADAKALEAAGRYKEALQAANEAVTRARELAFAPVLVEALSRRGAIQDLMNEDVQAEPTLLEALGEADAARMDAAKAHLLVSLVRNAGRREDAAAGPKWAQLAEGAIRRVGSGERERARLQQELGFLYGRLGKPEPSELHLRESHRLYEKLGEPLAAAVVLSTLGQVQNMAGRLGDAAATLRKARELLAAQVGEEHPRTGVALYGLAEVVGNQGRSAEARELCQKAYEMAVRSAGEDSVSVTFEMTCLGKALVALGRADEAVAVFRKAYAIKEKALGAQSEETLYSQRYLTIALAESGRHDEARATAEKLVAHRRKTLTGHENELAQDLWATGRVHLARGDFKLAAAALEEALALTRRHQLDDNVPAMQLALAQSYNRMGQARQALPLLNQALEKLEKGAGTEQPVLAAPLAALGEAQLLEGRRELAGPALQRALALSEQGQGNPALTAQLRALLAKAGAEP